MFRSGEMKYLLTAQMMNTGLNLNIYLRKYAVERVILETIPKIRENIFPGNTYVRANNFFLPWSMLYVLSTYFCLIACDNKDVSL